jgi:catechol 2,3-dioxygenase-like lactoylglutathione lyase family enzyme
MLSLVVIRARDMEKLAKFYSALGFSFVRHRHGKGPEHFSSAIGGAVFEIYPASNPEESTTSTRLGFSVPSSAPFALGLGNLHRAGRRRDRTECVKPFVDQAALQ